MNRYAFNVFLEKQRNNQQVEEGILGKAAVAARRAMKDSETVKTVRGVGAVVRGAKQATGPGARKAFSTGYQRGIEQGQGVRGSVKRGLSGALEKGVRSVVKDPRTAKKVVGLGKKAGGRLADFVKSGGFSGKFNRDMEARGVGSGIQYKSALGALKGGASTQIIGTEPGQDPLAGLSPAEKRRARMTGAAGPVTS